MPLIAHPWPIHFVMLVPRSRQRESKLVPHHNGCLSLPSLRSRGGTIIRGSIDLSAAGPRAAILPPITNSTYPFAIFQSEKSTLFFYESLRMYSRSLVGYFHGYFIVARRARSGGRGIILPRIEREESRRRTRERQLGGNSQGGSISFPFVFTSPREVENCCRRGRWTRDTSIFPPLLARDSLAFREEEESRWRNDGRSGGEFFGFSRRKKERKWCLWRNVFVKDSLTRSSLPEYYFTWRGFTNLGQRRPPSSSSSFVRLDYATTLFPCLSFLAFLFFPFPFPLSFLSLSRNSPHSYHSFCVPVEIGRRLADGDFRARVSRIPREICASLGWKNDPTNKRRRRNTIHNRCRFVSFSLYCKNEN